MRLIDADKMKEYMRDYTSKELMENEEVFEIIDEQPTISFGNVVELNMTQTNTKCCKDCQYFMSIYELYDIAQGECGMNEHIDEKLKEKFVCLKEKSVPLKEHTVIHNGFNYEIKDCPCRG